MPFVTVTFAGNRSDDIKARLIADVTKVVADGLSVPAEAVEVVLQAIEPAHWGVGGVGLDVIFAQRNQVP